MEKSFIEVQFPVSKVSKESYKERKAGASQTLTGLGKWWGRKPLVLVRAAILGCLLPATDNPQKDNEIFLKLMTMDDAGLLLRKEKSLTAAELFKVVCANKSLHKYFMCFDTTGKTPKLNKGVSKEEIEEAVFKSLGYDAKIALCKRPENVTISDDQTWREINHHLNTDAHSLPELVQQLSERKFGHTVRVGDCFCGGGSIPFEAARIGCDAFGSDLNPVASILSWSAINLVGAEIETLSSVRSFQEKVFENVEKKIEKLGVELNEKNDRAITYLYCTEVKCPDCGRMIPVSPSWVVSKASSACVAVDTHNGGYSFHLISDASEKEMDTASKGTISARGVCCPFCKKVNAISTIRHDSTQTGSQISGLRQWECSDCFPLEDDVFHQRLYAIRYQQPNGKRYYRSPNEQDLLNEKAVIEIVSKNIIKWQNEGVIPTASIESGYNTDQIIRERGWRYWHQLFNPRQLLTLALLQETIGELAQNQLQKVVGVIGLNRCLDNMSQLCRWHGGRDEAEQTFYNQALNTLFNYGNRTFALLKTSWFGNVSTQPVFGQGQITIGDARRNEKDCDIWITDPPYADAVNYHELTEFFLAWDKKLLLDAFPMWYADSKRVLAVRGDEHFSQTMIDIYSNLTKHMSDDGMQIVMFTHSDPSVWAQLALIMWKAGLTVTAAWNIATETDAAGLREGNYVKGTVILVLRKQKGEEEAFLDELTADIKSEVKKQIDSMQKLDDKEDPNFSDPDYVLAAYAASLKVLTSYKSIGEIDLDYELNLAINDPSKSEVVKLIERAKRIAYDCIIPSDFDNYLWRELSPAERFYIKGLEAEKHGNYQISTYQEYARGFGIASYGQMMASERANTARLKTPSEFAMRSISDVPGFENSMLRIVLAAVHIAVKEDENPQMGLWHLKTTVPNYWDHRDMLKQLLSYLAECKDIDTMPHWNVCGEMASHIYTLVDNDRI